VTFLAIDNSWWMTVFILIGGGLATDIWRWFGVLAGGRLREDSQLVIWVKSVATALVAGVIGKLVLYPFGALAEVPVFVRVAALALGWLAFIGARQSIIAGVMIAEIVLVLSAWFIG